MLSQHLMREKLGNAEDLEEPRFEVEVKKHLKEIKKQNKIMSEYLSVLNEKERSSSALISFIQAYEKHPPCLFESDILNSIW